MCSMTVSRYSMQLMDEIPMVWSSGAFIYTIYMVRILDFIKSICLFMSQTTSKPGEKGLLPLCMLSLYCTLFTIIYSIWTHPIVHQVIHLD